MFTTGIYCRKIRLCGVHTDASGLVFVLLGAPVARQLVIGPEIRRGRHEKAEEQDVVIWRGARSLGIYGRPTINCGRRNEREMGVDEVERSLTD